MTGIGASPASGGDFVGGVLPTGTLTFAAGETVKTITLNVAGDTTVEPNENFLLSASGTSGSANASASYSGTIIDDDGTTSPPSGGMSLAFSATTQTKPEGNSGSTPFTFTLTRSGATTGAVTVNYAVTGSGANAANAADFTGGTLPTGTVTFAAGETTKTITINAAGDTTVESDEGFTLTATGSGATATISGAITNDDGTTPPAGGVSLALSSAAPSQSEGNSGTKAFTFTLTRSGDTTGVTNVSYGVTGAGGSPANAADFVGGVLPSGTVSFAAGETTKTITINVAGDTTTEPDEAFTLSAQATGGVTASASLNGAILNDDGGGPPSGSIGLMLNSAAPSQSEGNSGSTPFTFTLTRSGDTSGVTNVGYVVTGATGAPADASDFTGGALPSGTVSFAAGETTKTITINVAGDTVSEANEGFMLTATQTGGSAFAYYYALIVNDDGGGVPEPKAALGISVQSPAAAYQNILRAAPTSAAAADFLAGLTGRSPVDVLDAIVDKALNTTSVASLAYAFFTGKIPTQAGLDYLISPTGPNANNLNSAYYQSFNLENRFINFAVNLGKVGEGSQGFQAAYGGKSLFDAAKSAYLTLFGSTPTDDKVHALIDSRADYFAYYGGDGPNGIGTKAAMVGWLLAEAAKADTGIYAKANDAFLSDLADGANFGVDLVGVYGRPEFNYAGP